MKIGLKEKAVYLRRNEGLSYKEISDKLGVGKSTLHYWLKDIKLSKRQLQKLKVRSNEYVDEARRITSQKRIEKYKEIRKQYQKCGRREVSIFDLHLIGCMLYWGEGSKGRNMVSFTNTDLGMMKLFLRFLRECYDVDDSKIKMICHSHILSTKSLEDVQKYWLSSLGLPRCCLNKGRVEKRIPKKKSVKYPYGICVLRVNSTEIVQRIFGAIKEYAGINDDGLWIG